MIKLNLFRLHVFSFASLSFSLLCLFRSIDICLHQDLSILYVNYVKVNNLFFDYYLVLNCLITNLLILLFFLKDNISPLYLPAEQQNRKISLASLAYHAR